MKQEKTIKNITFINKVICTKCGEVLWTAPPGERIEPFVDYIEIQKVWNKRSSYPGRIDEVHLCEKCYGLIAADFKHPSIVGYDSTIQKAALTK